MTFTVLKSAGLEIHVINFILQMNNIKPLRDLVACMRLPIQIQISSTQQYSFFHSARIFPFFFFLIFDFGCLCTATTIDYCVAHDSDNTLMSPAWQPQASR